MSIKLSLLSLLICGTLLSQTSPLVVVSSTGKFNYIGDAKKNLLVSNGALLASSGKLKVKEKSSVVLLCNEGFNIIKTGNQNLSTLCGGTESISSAGFDGSFSNDVLAAVELTYVLKDQSPAWSKLKDPNSHSGDGWGVKDKGGWGVGDKGGWGVGDKGGWGVGDKGGWGVGDKGGWGVGDKGGWGVGDKGGWGVGDKGGWGGNGSIISPIMPIGYVPSALVRFTWSRPANIGSYVLRIIDINKRIVDSVITKDTFALIDLSKPIYDTDDRFTWNVSTLNNPIEIVSSSYEFSTISEDPMDKIKSKLNKSKIYKKLDPSAKMLMEATAYEQEQLYYNASETYNQVIKKDSKNKLARMMSAAFWVRGGMNLMAEAVVNR